MRLLALSLILAACSDGAGTSLDGPPVGGDGAPSADAREGVDSQPAAGGGCAPEVQLGRLSIEPRGLSGSITDRPQPERFLVHEATVGACSLWSAGASFCDPACTYPQQCEDSVCVDPPGNLRIGAIIIQGPGGRIDAEPTSAERPYYSGSSKVPIYGAGDTVHLEAGGDGAITGFGLDLVGHEEVALTTEPSYELTLTENVGLTMSWTPSTSPGARVLLHMDSDHHGAPGFIECEADDADGTFSVDPALGDRLIEIGASGIGTYVENAYVVRDHRAKVDLAQGCLEVATMRQDWISVETVLDR